jgi:hypothetical protein
MVFQSKEILPIQVYSQIRFAYEDVWMPEKIKATRVTVNLEIDNAIPWGFFDGASQGNPRKGRAGVLFLKEGYSVSFKAALGEGSNNWTELNALWLLLRTATEYEADKIQIMGDSKVVIDWINSKHNL